MHQPICLLANLTAIGSVFAAHEYEYLQSSVCSNLPNEHIRLYLLGEL